MMQWELDLLARQVLLDAARLEYGALLDDWTEPSFSAAFELRMGKLLRRAAHPVRRRAAQAVACGALLALLSGCSLLAFSPEARAVFVDWIQEIRASWSVYRYTGEAEEEMIETVYYPAWVPEGYSLKLQPEAGTFVRSLYEDGQGRLLNFSYLRGRQDTTLQIQWEGAVVRAVTVNGIPGELYQNPGEGPNVLLWADQEKDTLFWLTAALSPEDLLRVAESTQESEPLPRRYQLTYLPPGGYFLAEQWEEAGKGEVTYEGDLADPDSATGEATIETRVTFGYSDDLPAGTPYDSLRDSCTAEPVKAGELEGELFQTGQGETVLLWQDESHLFWICALLEPEDVLRVAQGVAVRQNRYADTMGMAAGDFEGSDEPLLEKVEEALTDDFVAQVQELARQDALAGEYMRQPYRELWKRQMAECVSPDRETSTAFVSRLIQSMGRERQESVAALFGPFYSANISVGIFSTTAHICDEYGEMIAGYNSHNAEWTSVPTCEEEQFGYITTQLYAQSYQEARAALQEKETIP